jgi:S1-C subfamily serine protease
MSDNNQYFENGTNQNSGQFKPATNTHQDPENIYTQPLSRQPKPPVRPTINKQSPNTFMNLLWGFVVFLVLFGLLLGVYVIAKSPNKLGLDKYLDSANKAANNVLSQSSAINTKQAVQFAPQEGARSTVEVVSKNLPAVLSINVQTKQNGASVAGTGYIVSSDGLVITNKHVVALGCRFGQSGIQITALANDQKAYSADLLSVDPIDDIAILQLKDKNNSSLNLTPVEFGDSAQLQQGEEVIAIGNALGTFQNSVTKGIISGLNRSFDTAGLKDECTNSDVRTDGLIQTDAAINQGNSGGPLFNAAGQLIGMNTLGSPDAQNVGLAIPSETIATVLNSYKSNQAIIRPRLGVVSQEVNAARKLDNSWLPVEYGEFVGSFDVAIAENKVISPGSAAEAAGLSFGDIILEIDGKKLESTQDNPNPLRRLILNKQSGQSIKLTVLKAIKSSNSRQINYEPTPISLSVTLKGLNYDVKTGELINSEG